MASYTYGNCPHHPDLTVNVEIGYDEITPKTIHCILCAYGEQLGRIYKPSAIIYKGDGWAKKDLKKDERTKSKRITV